MGGRGERWIVKKDAKKSKEAMVYMLEDEIRAIESTMRLKRAELVDKKERLAQLEKV